MTNDEVKKVLDEIAAANGGRLRPGDVVDAARPKSHPLHGRFTWDDKKAGAAHRIGQARELIRAVKVQITTTTRQVSASFYTHDATSRDPGYLSVVKVRSEEDVARATIAQEFGRAVGALERARNQALAVGLHAEAALADRALALLSVTQTATVEEAA